MSEHEWANEKKFLDRVKSHRMHVIRDDGTYRHVRFSKEGTSDDRFDLITWPWHLCYTGDMGTYVFSRVEDMFKFFRCPPWKEGETTGVNEGYWAEKCLADDAHSGLREFSEKMFRDVVREDFESMVESSDLDKEGREELWDAIESDVLSCIESGEGAARVVASEFECRVQGETFRFEDFWEHNFQTYTGRFIWACYAIAWGIKQYEAAKLPAPDAEKGGERP